MGKEQLTSISVLNTPVVGDATIVGGKSVITGVGDQFRPDDIVSFVRTAFSAGVESEKTFDLSGVSIVQGRANRFEVTHNGVARTYIVFLDTGDTTTDLQVGLLARIEQDTDAVVENNTSAAANLKLKLKSTALNGGDFSVTAKPDGSTEVVNVAFVAPAGTPSIVEGFDSVNASATGEYATYEFTVSIQRDHYAVGGNLTGDVRKILIFAEETDAGFAGFDARIQSIGDNTSLDDYRENSALSLDATTITATATLTKVNGFIKILATVGATDITLPDSASVGPDRIIPILDLGSSQTVRFLKAGSDTINGGANVTLVTAKTALLFNDGAGAWLLRVLD